MLCLTALLSLTACHFAVITASVPMGASGSSIGHPAHPAARHLRASRRYVTFNANRTHNLKETEDQRILVAGSSGVGKTVRSLLALALDNVERLEPWHNFSCHVLILQYNNITELYQ